MKPTDININTLLSIAKENNYKIYTAKDSLSKRNRNYNLNIWGIRSTNSKSDKYDDYEIVFREAVKPIYHTINTEHHTRKYDNGWVIDIFLITTNPGTPMLLKPMNPKGAAILKYGQYINMWRKGFHKGDKEHPALIQVNPCTVYRDNNKNDILDYNVPTETGMFGINNHRQSKWKLINWIGLNSAGCQVHFNYKVYTDVFLYLIDEAIKEGTDLFTYTLISEETYAKKR